MEFSKIFGIRLYILFAIFAPIIPIGLVSVLILDAASKLIMVLILGLVFLLALIVVLYRIFFNIYYSIKEINGKDSTFKQSTTITNLAKFVGVMPVYEQLEKLSHEYKLLYHKNQMLLNTKQTDNLKGKKDAIIEHDVISLSNNYKLDYFINISEKIIRYITNADSCSIMFYDKEEAALKIVASAGLSSYPVEELKMKPNEGIAGKTFQEQKSIMVEDVKKYSQFVISSEHKKAGQILYSVPLKTSDECIGVININTKTPLPQDMCKLIETIASQISMVIQNALLFKSMEELAIRDSLTGLYNHRYFHQVLAKEIKRAIRYNRPLSLVILDIDNFKQYNDNYGHMLGDHLLKEIGRAIQNNLRSSDILARYGGDELAIILPETDGESAYALLERIRRKISEYPLITPEVFSGISSELINEDAKELFIKNNTIWDNLFKRLKKATSNSQGDKQNPPGKVTLSAGICSQSKTVKSKEDLIKKADRALLKAKRIGKNQICIHSNVFKDSEATR